MTKSDTRFGYFPVNEQAIATGFYLTGAGVEHIGANQTYPIATHPEMYNFSWNTGRILPEYQLVFVFEGYGEFESQETGHIRLRPGMAIFLLPDVWHRYRPNPATGWADYWISFNGIIPHIWQQAGALTAAQAIQKVSRPSVTSAALAEILRIAVEVPENPGPASFSALAILAQLLAGRRLPAVAPVAAEEKILPGHAAEVMVRKALDIIWNHSHRNLSATLIARQLGVTRRTLERHFKAVHHRTVLAELTTCRISRAKLMLVNTHLPIKRIARAAGFSSPTHLATAFRRELQTTPRQIRKKPSECI